MLAVPEGFGGRWAGGGGLQYSSGFQRVSGRWFVGGGAAQVNRLGPGAKGGPAAAAAAAAEEWKDQEGPSSLRELVGKAL